LLIEIRMLQLQPIVLIKWSVERSSYLWKNHMKGSHQLNCIAKLKKTVQQQLNSQKNYGK